MTSEIREFYEDFSLQVGQRDWQRPNPRHEQLKLLVDELLQSKRNLDLVDVGCGAGVMADHLTKHGRVTGVDYSQAAIDLARRMAPDVEFHQGSLEALPDAAWDVVCLFDVLEHIPVRERVGFLAELRGQLRDGGLLIISTPHPDFTRWRRHREPEALQIVDEAVDLGALLDETQGLVLVRYHAYDVWRGSPEYQFAAFTTARGAGGPPELRTRSLERKLRRHALPGATRLRDLLR